MGHNRAIPKSSQLNDAGSRHCWGFLASGVFLIHFPTICVLPRLAAIRRYLFFVHVIILGFYSNSDLAGTSGQSPSQRVKERLVLYSGVPFAGWIRIRWMTASGKDIFPTFQRHTQMMHAVRKFSLNSVSLLRGLNVHNISENDRKFT